MVDQAFGGSTGHSFDLMALDSKCDEGERWFTSSALHPFSGLCSEGVNLFCEDLRAARLMSYPYMYFFPSFGLIGPILRFLVPFKIPFTVVIPEFVPHPYWWPELMARCGRKLCIAKQGEKGALLYPSRSGFRPVPGLATLWAVRVSRF